MIERGTRRRVKVVYLLVFDTWHSIEWAGDDRSEGHVMSSTNHSETRLVSGSLLVVKCWNSSGTVVADILRLGFNVFFFFFLLLVSALVSMLN